VRVCSHMNLPQKADFNLAIHNWSSRILVEETFESRNFRKPGETGYQQIQVISQGVTVNWLTSLSLNFSWSICNIDANLYPASTASFAISSCCSDVTNPAWMPMRTVTSSKILIWRIWLIFTFTCCFFGLHTRDTDPKQCFYKFAAQNAQIWFINALLFSWLRLFLKYFFLSVAYASVLFRMIDSFSLIWWLGCCKKIIYFNR